MGETFFQTLLSSHLLILIWYNLVIYPEDIFSFSNPKAVKAEQVISLRCWYEMCSDEQNNVSAISFVTKLSVLGFWNKNFHLQAKAVADPLRKLRLSELSFLTQRQVRLKHHHLTETAESCYPFTYMNEPNNSRQTQINYCYEYGPLTVMHLRFDVFFVTFLQLLRL